MLSYYHTRCSRNSSLWFVGSSFDSIGACRLILLDYVTRYDPVRFHRRNMSLRKPANPTIKKDPSACNTEGSGACNSLFKVLCIFPLRYLFAIGLDKIFSLRCDIPSAWRSHPRERDSGNANDTPHRLGAEQDFHRSSPFLPEDVHPSCCSSYVMKVQNRGNPALEYGLVLLHSPLLQESCFVSFPPLTYMLKFRG